MKTLLERRNRIRDALESTGNDPNRETYAISRWRGDTLVLNVIRIESDYLMYRIENSRTKRQQIKYLHDRPELEEGFFNDPEEPAAQQAQEEILKGLLGEDFIEDLTIRGQEDPAIITHEGYIVNGNRRTAALRQLKEEHIQCVVLPQDATKKELFALEQELQISREFKEEYHWVNELLNIYSGITDPELDFDEEVMARRLRIRKTTLQAKIRTFELISDFLDWSGKRGDYGYERLDLARQAFTSLESGLRNKEENRKTEELRNAVFTLVEKPPTQGRLYTHVSKLIKHWDAIYGTICQDKGLIPSPDDSESDTSPDPEPGKLLERITSQVPYDSVPRVFSDPIEAEELSSELLEITAEIIALSKEISEAEAVYDAVSSALRELKSLSITDDTTHLEATNNKLNEIISASKKLKDQIARFT